MTSVSMNVKQGWVTGLRTHLILFGSESDFSVLCTNPDPAYGSEYIASKTNQQNEYYCYNFSVRGAVKFKPEYAHISTRGTLSQR